MIEYYMADIWEVIWTPRKHQITLNKKQNWGRLSEDSIITQVSVADDKILEEMEKTGTGFDKYLDDLVDDVDDDCNHLKNDIEDYLDDMELEVP